MELADSQPTRNEIEQIFKRLRGISSNKVCFDCTAKNPTWASVTYGVFICIDCSAVHRSLGVHLTFVRSTQLDTKWTWLQLRQMQLGGNANAESFFQQHNCTTKDAQQKYNSRAAQLYSDKLMKAASHAMKLHGTKLHLDEHTVVETEEVKEVDFFEEHNDFEPTENFDSGVTNAFTKLSTTDPSEPAKGPSVNLNQESSSYKPIIGARKAAPKKSGLGTKKSGLGAQRVKTNFADIEREAELADQLKVQEKKTLTTTEPKSQEEEEAQILSMRLVYEDISMKKKQEEEKMKAIDPIKAQQMERLGMGLGARTGISHSAISNMKTIEQESPVKQGKSKDRRDSLDLFDDFSFSSSSNNGFDMYKSTSETLSVSYMNDPFKTSKSASSSLWSEEVKPVEKKTSPTVIAHSHSGEAQKKFGSAKAISSDQYFSDSNDTAWERKTNLSRFEGSSSISSAEYFGKPETSYRGGLTPDLEDVKESVRLGVTKVAGKISSLANGVMSSIQERYGGFD